MTTLGARLREERERLGLSQVAFCEKGDVGKHSQINYESDRRSPDAKYLTLIGEIGVDVMYVLTGVREAEALKKVLADARQPELDLLEKSVDVTRQYWESQRRTGGWKDFAHPLASDGLVSANGDEFTLIPRVDVDVSAGQGLVPTEVQGEEHIAVSRAWLTRHLINPEQCGLVRVKGDSMSPTIPDGALALVHRSEMTVDKEGIYAFSRDGQAYIKRLAPIGGNGDGQLAALIVMSDNPAYPPETISGADLNSIHIAGRVRTYIVAL